MVIVEHLPELSAIPQKLDAIWLRDWQKRNGFTNAHAGLCLALSESAYRRQKTGRSRLGAQTVLLVMYTDIHRHNWLELAEMAGKLAKLTGFAP